MSRRYAQRTEVVRLGRPQGVPGAAVNPPVVLSAPFHQGGATAYGRESNPTWTALEEAIGGLEGGTAVSFASGLAAVAGVMEMLPVPGAVVLPADAYSGTRRFLADVAGRGRLSFKLVDTADTAATLRACEEVGRQAKGAGFGSGGLLWLESPTNPLLAVADLQALSEGAHSLGMDVVVDNTFATPLVQRPLELGADAVVHSATKFLSGHSDVLSGAVVSHRADVVEALVARRSLHGAIPGPWEAWIVLRGIRTLDVRMERAQANAADLARRLLAHPAVERVRYPGLSSHPGHDLASRQMSGFGAMVSFELPDAAAADAVVGRLQLLTAATSLGGVETLIERRARWEGEEHVPPGLLRLSVGIEDVDDLWEDLAQALSSLR